MVAPPTEDLPGRLCLVTGASAGIGKEVARALARMGARVVLGCRNPSKAEVARSEIVSSTGNDAVEVSLVDFSSQKSIRDFAGRLGSTSDSLDVLVNNAGIWAGREQKGADGLELTWATNVLGYFLLTELLRPLIAKARGGRIVSVASEFAGDLDLGDVEFKRRGWSGVKAYRQSKQANRMWTWALARRLQGTTTTANVMHPGGVNTELFAKAGGLTGFLAGTWARIGLKTPAEGADTAVWLAASPKVEGVSGRFWVERSERPCSFRGRDGEEKLWELCATMTGL